MRMSRVRCTICRQQMPNLKTLKSHYMTGHSKIQIVRELFKNSVLNATPSLFPKSKRRKTQDSYKTIYLHDKVQITYNKDTIVIEDESAEDNLIQLSFQEDKTQPEKTEVKRKSRKKKSEKLFQIGIQKVTEPPKSLHENTGEFYVCHCRTAKPSSDTDSGSDTGKVYFCSFCGSGFHTVSELHKHEDSHQYFCKLCNKIFNLRGHKEHADQHVVRIFVCHVCGFEFMNRSLLVGHLGYHFEQQTFEHILNMEQDYNMYGLCNTSFSTGDYYANINNILFFLTYPYDHFYARNMFMKVVCDLCFQEFFIYDYERHLKVTHFLR